MRSSLCGTTPMLRPRFRTLLAVCVLGVAARAAWAQTDGGAQPRTLSDALQQLRQDLTGNDPQSVEAEPQLLPQPPQAQGKPQPQPQWQPQWQTQPQPQRRTIFNPNPRPASRVAPAVGGTKVPAASGAGASRPATATSGAQRVAATSAVDKYVGDDMPIPPPAAPEEMPAPRSRMVPKKPKAASGNQTTPAAFEDGGADDGGHPSSRRSDAAGLRTAMRPGSALSPIPVDAATQPGRSATSQPIVQPESHEPAPIADRSAEPNPMRNTTKPDLSPPPITPRIAAKSAPPAEEPLANKKSSPAADGVLLSGQSAPVTVEVIGPKSVTIGKEAVFSIRVRNPADIPTTGVTVSIGLPSHVEVLASQPTNGTVQSPTAVEDSTSLEWQIRRVEPRSRETLTLKLAPRRNSPIELAVQWTTAPDNSVALVEVQEPRLALNLTGPTEIMYGHTKIYKITMTNPGNGDAENVVVNLLPVGRGGDGGASRRMGTLRPGQSKTVEVELTARQSGTLNIKAEASADGGLMAEAIEHVIVRRANLKALVQAPKVKFAGAAANYQILVGNTGNAAADNVAVTALLPAQAKYVSGTSGAKVDAVQGKVTWNIGSLPAGTERTFELHCSLHTSGENRIQVGATSADEQTVSTAAVTRVEAVADLKLEIRDPQGPVAVGDEAVYEIVIRNRGSKSAERVDLVTFFSEGLEAVRATGGSHQIDRGQVVFRTVPTLAPGAELVLKVMAKAETAANHVFRAEVTCQSPQLKLSAEETTLFYGEENTSPAPTTGEPTLLPEPAALQPAQ